MDRDSDDSGPLVINAATAGADIDLTTRGLGELIAAYLREPDLMIRTVQDTATPEVNGVDYTLAPENRPLLLREAGREPNTNKQRLETMIRIALRELAALGRLDTIVMNIDGHWGQLPEPLRLAAREAIKNSFAPCSTYGRINPYLNVVLYMNGIVPEELRLEAISWIRQPAPSGADVTMCEMIRNATDPNMPEGFHLSPIIVNALFDKLIEQRCFDAIARKLAAALEPIEPEIRIRALRVIGGEGLCIWLSFVVGCELYGSHEREKRNLTEQVMRTAKEAFDAAIAVCETRKDIRDISQLKGLALNTNWVTARKAGDALLRMIEKGKQEMDEETLTLVVTVTPDMRAGCLAGPEGLQSIEHRAGMAIRDIEQRKHALTGEEGMLLEGTVPRPRWMRDLIARAAEFKGRIIRKLRVR